MHPASKILIGARLAALGAAAWFGTRYNRVHWERTPEGKNVMAMTASIGATALTGVIAELRRTPWAVVTAAIPWLSVADVLIWRNALRERGEMAWHRDHPEDHDSQHCRKKDGNP